MRSIAPEFRRISRVRYAWCIALLCAAACWALPESSAAQAPYRRIAKTGDPVPGVPGAVFDLIGIPTIDANGNVALRNRMDGPGIGGLNDDAIFYGQPGNLSFVVREGELFPEFGEGVYQRFLSQPFMAQSGEIGYEAKLDGPGITSADDDIVWAGTPGSLTVVARQGQAPPGINDGSVLDSPVSVEMGRNGHIGLRAGILMPGGVKHTGLWSGMPNDLNLVARSGAQAPGVEPGVTFPSTGVLAPSRSVNARGALAFPAFLEGPGIDGTNNAGIWAGTSDDLSIVMRAGAPAPVPEPNVQFVGRPDGVQINGNDRVLFRSFVTGPGISGANDLGLWVGAAGAPVELVAREGDAVPVLGADYAMTGFATFLQTEDDRVMILPEFTGPGVTLENDQAILFGGDDDWELIFREGDQAPGLPDGVVFDFTNRSIQISMNENGAAGMLLGLTGNGVTETNDEALFWRPSEFDPWQLVAREGELFDGSLITDGGLDISVGGGGAGGRPGMNDRGDLVFRVQFEDQPSGLVTGAYIVPAPPTVFVLAISLFALDSRRRRSNARRSRSNMLHFVSMLIAVWSMWTPAAQAQAPYRRIAKTGDPVPGMSGAAFTSIGLPSIDANGNVVLRNRMTGPGINARNDDAIYHGQPNNLGIVIREGQLVPQFGPDITIRLLSQPLMAQTGEIAIDAALDGDVSTSANDVLLAGLPDNLQTVVREGNIPPDVNDGLLWGRSFNTSMGSNGHLALRSDLREPGYTGPPLESGLFSGPPDNPRLVARTGDQAPGTEPGVQFSLAYVAPNFTVNSRGAMAFPALIDGPGVGALNAGGIWAGTHDDLGIVMRAGDPAPLPEPNATFYGTPSGAVINANDHVMFPAFVTGPGITGSNDFAMWIGDTSGNLEVIAREGDEVPVLGPNYSITGIYPYLFSEDDQVTLVESFDGPGVTPTNDEVILFGESGDLELLFREGDQAPGLPDGVVLDFDVDTPKIAIVETGAAAMLLGLSGSGVTETNDEALFWRPSADAAWQLVAREGEMFDGSIIRDGGLFIWAGGGAAGGKPSLNERGDLAFWIQFEGDSPNDVYGAYIVPEPCTTILALLNLVLISQRKRRSAVDR